MSAATFTAFIRHRRIATGAAADVAAAGSLAQAGETPIIFADATGLRVEIDPFADPPALALPASASPALASPAPVEAESPEPESATTARRGRPRLGVVAREVTLLPRHWDWLSSRPGGASAALRRLVDEARRASGDADVARQAQDALYRVMSVLAGDLPGFEEASRAVYAGDDVGFDMRIAQWPADVRAYVGELAAAERAARTA
jgi:hypothetical protein